MAPRQRRAPGGAAAAAAPAADFQQLPDGVLVHILSKLDAPDRHRAALVSRRWHQCAHAPELCRRVELQRLLFFRQTVLDYAAAIASLAAWMLRHGRHVCSLKVVYMRQDVPSAEAQAKLACCLAACAGGQLASLHVHICASPLVVAAWAPALRSLCQLRLVSRSELLISSSLHGLTQLTQLALGGSPVSFAEGARLPPSLEQLSLTDRSSQSLPEQLAGLSRLSVLDLQGGHRTAEGYSRLTQLTTLTRLQLCENSHLPACLEQLTTLQALVLDSVAAQAADAQQAGTALNAALAPLTQLTSLLVVDCPAHGGMPALAGLSRLRRACFIECGGLDSLPTGPWCGSLQTLGASWDCLHRSQQFRAAAQQLQEVAVLGGCQQTSFALLRWAGTYPPLCRLQLVLNGQVPAELLGGVLNLMQQRPQLQVTHRLQAAAYSEFRATFMARFSC